MGTGYGAISGVWHRMWCHIRCDAPNKAYIWCISVPTSGASTGCGMHYPVRCTGCGMHYPVRCTGSGMYYPVHLGAHIRCAAPDVACIIRCTAPDLACIIRCISVPTSGALHHRVRTPHHRVPRDGYSSRFPCGRARRSRQGTSAPVDGRNKGWWEGGFGVSAARTGGRWQAGVAVAAADDAYLAPRGVHTVGRRGDDELSERQRGLGVRDAGATAVSTQPVARGRWASSSGQESVKAGARKTA